MGSKPTTAARLTEEQRGALETRGVSIALSAGAGCGKTFVLTERFLREVAPDGRALRSELSDVVAITFTERAAREMRERIRLKTRERLLQATEETEIDFWLSLERQLDTARVTTIHSFCVSLLRAHAIDAGLDPSFAVLDEKQTEALRTAVVEDQLRRALVERRGAAMDVVFHFGISGTRSFLSQTLRERHAFDLSAWRDSNTEELLARWQAFFVEQYRPAKVREFCQHPTFQTIESMVRGELPGDVVMRGRCEQLVELIDRLPHAEDIVATLEQIKEQAKIVKAKKERDGVWGLEDYERFAKAAEKLRKRITDSCQDRNRWVFDPVAARLSAEQGVHLLELAGEVIFAYEAQKRAAAALDFEDLLLRARDLLCHEDRAALRRAIGEQIRLLLVDEFQDTDPLQVELVQALCDAAIADGKLFFVGDLKQSIYRFRGARPDVFRTLRESMPEEGRLPLTRNFRSQPEILAFVNALFRDELGPDYEPLIADRPQVTAPPAIEFLWAVGEEEGDDDAARKPDKEMEAEWIARRLRAMLDQGEERVFTRDASGAPVARAVRQGDIAILLRAMTNVEYYEAALRRYGIDYYVVGGHAFYAQQEVYDLLNLLRSLTSRLDDVSLVGALRSPYFSLADESIYWLAQHAEGLRAGLFAETPPRQLDPIEKAKAVFAAKTLRELAALKDRVPIATLLQEILERTGYDAILAAEFLGERKLANLHKLVDQARGMDAAGIFTLDDFVTQLAQFTATPPKEPPAATLAENADVVRLMSIHQSKGLEFPVVVVANTNSRQGSFPSSFELDPQLGPLVRAKRDTGLVGLDMWRVLNAEEESAERSRLLYVATTRAADHLILAGSMKELGKAEGPWTKLLEKRFDLTTGELLAELPEEYDRPQVRVIASEPECERPKQERQARVDWNAIIEKAQELASLGGGHTPRTVAPLPVDHAARRRFSFSRLSGKLVIDDPEEDLPVAGGVATTEDARSLGQLVHTVLEQLDFAAHEHSEELIRLFAPRFLPLDSPDLEVAREMLMRFAKSETAAQLTGAKEVHRELPFQLRWPLDAPVEKAMHIEGVIDVLFQDAAGCWHILDFKTNQTGAERVSALARRYESQLFLYSEAVRAALGVAPASATLYFLAPGVAHSLAWDDAAVQSLTEAIDAAIVALRQTEPDAPY